LVGGVCHFRVQVWFSNPKCSQPTLPQAYPQWSTPKDSSLFKQTPGMLKLCRKGGGDGWSRQFGWGCIPLTGAGVVQQPPVLSSLTLSRIPTLEHTQRILIIHTDTCHAQALQQRMVDGWSRQFGGGCMPLKGVGLEKRTPALSALTPSGIPTLEQTQILLIIYTDTWNAQALQQRR